MAGNNTGQARSSNWNRSQGRTHERTNWRQDWALGARAGTVKNCGGRGRPRPEIACKITSGPRPTPKHFTRETNRSTTTGARPWTKREPRARALGCAERSPGRGNPNGEQEKTATGNEIKAKSLIRRSHAQDGTTVVEEKRSSAESCTTNPENFLIGHPSWNYSGLSTLNLRVLCR
jgi:hypothetical protein